MLQLQSNMLTDIRERERVYSCLMYTKYTIDITIKLNQDYYRVCTNRSGELPSGDFPPVLSHLPGDLPQFMLHVVRVW